MANKLLKFMRLVFILAIYSELLTTELHVSVYWCTIFLLVMSSVVFSAVNIDAVILWVMTTCNFIYLCWRSRYQDRNHLPNCVVTSELGQWEFSHFILSDYLNLGYFLTELRNFSSIISKDYSALCVINLQFSINVLYMDLKIWVLYLVLENTSSISITGGQQWKR